MTPNANGFQCCAAESICAYSIRTLTADTTPLSPRSADRGDRSRAGDAQATKVGQPRTPHCQALDTIKAPRLGGENARRRKRDENAQRIAGIQRTGVAVGFIDVIVAGPYIVAKATSLASRPLAIRTRPSRSDIRVASKITQRWPR